MTTYIKCRRRQVTCLMIKVLSNDTIQKIAAGEVVERPASIVKELVENAMDAHASTIRVEIKNGGKSFIKVTDDGDGIPKDQAALAFERHATSKIDEFNDLYKIYTMGFRGEALASIAAVANVEMYTKTKDQKTGIYLSFEDNQLASSKTIAMNKGTIIEVNNLFSNIPVRKKFLASDQAEANKISNLMYRFAIANEDKSIIFMRDGREIFSTNKNQTLIDDLNTLFGNEYSKNALKIESELGDYKLHGYISNVNYYKGNRSQQYIFVNRRYIEHPELTSTIEAAYHALIPSGRFPAFQLFIETDPKNIDINLSPNKQKIKFHFSDDLFMFIKNTISETIIAAQKPKLLEVEEEKLKPNFYKLATGDSYQAILDAYHAPIETTFMKEDQKPFQNQEDIAESISLFELNGEDEDILATNLIDGYAFENVESEALDQQTKTKDEQDNKQVVLRHNAEQTEYLHHIGQVFDKFVVFEDKNLNKLLLLDLHATYERILYDELALQISQNSLLISDLLTPILVELGKRDMEIYLENQSFFKEIGYQIDMFGQKTLAIRSLPYIGDTVSDKQLFMDTLDSLNQNMGEESRYDLFKKCAISKASHRIYQLTKEEAYVIYERLMNTSNPYKTEHGRQIIFEITRHSFERLLK